MTTADTKRRPLDMLADATARMVRLFERATTAREKAAIMRRIARETNNGLVRRIASEASASWRRA